MTQAILSPFEYQDTVDLSRSVFRKQVLPLGSIDYKGRKITFDRKYLTELAESFRAGAFDQVPFVLADSQNRHTMDPERFRGEVKGLELTATGLDAIIEFPDEQAAAAVRNNMQLGVSARIVEGMHRADGKQFGKAIQHVLGTMDPRVNGLGPWRKIELSGYDESDTTLDLTSATYGGLEMPNGVTKPKPVQPVAEDPDLAIDSLTDEELEQLMQTDEQNSVEVEEDTPEGEVKTAEAPVSVPADLANESREAIDLANMRAEAALEQVRQLAADLARERWMSTRAQYVNDGVPPSLLDLAQPLLELPEDQVIDLANGQGVNASDIVRNILDQVRVLDLSMERGHTVPAAQSDPDEALLEAWTAQAPL